MRVEKPRVFNYQKYEEAVAENKRLMDKIANMEIKYRIAAEKMLEVDEVRETICDHCGAKYHYAKEWGEVNYCSNCGAMMGGDTE